MPASEHPLPDIAVGRHPDFGIVATNPKDLAASAWMLRGFGFHPVPGHLGLYALADQQHDGPERATRTVDLLRRANYRVEVDAEFDTFPTAPEPVPATTLSPRIEPIEPEVAFADHPRLGIVAATADHAVLGQELLEDHGWQCHPRLGVYTLPPATGRDQALRKLAQTTAAMHRAHLHVAVQPSLARDITTRRPPAPTRPAPREPSPDTATSRFPTRSAAALAASPARTDLSTAPPAPTPASAPASPADPRVAVSRPR